MSWSESQPPSADGSVLSLLCIKLATLIHGALFNPPFLLPLQAPPPQLLLYMMCHWRLICFVSQGVVSAQPPAFPESSQNMTYCKWESKCHYPFLQMCKYRCNEDPFIYTEPIKRGVTSKTAASESRSFSNFCLQFANIFGSCPSSWS